MNPEKSYAFLVAYNGATMRFDAPLAEAEKAYEDFNREVPPFRLEKTREHARETLRTALIEGLHLNPKTSPQIIGTAIWLTLSNHALFQQGMEPAGFVIKITDNPTIPGDANFRFMATRTVDAIEDMTKEERKNRKYIASITPEQQQKAVSRKKTPVSRDPSLEPPQKPRPERWLPEVAEAEKIVGKEALRDVRECLEEGACFVWKSRPIEDTSKEEIDASLAAMAEYDRLGLPFPRVWAETRDWISVQKGDGPESRLSCRFGIAAYESVSGITFSGFVDCADQIQMSLYQGHIDLALMAEGTNNLQLVAFPGAAATSWDEGFHRRIIKACGDRLLELLFLLATAGVAQEKVRQGFKGKAPKKKAAQRRLSARDYTIVRVPMHYVADSEGSAGGAGGTPGRWVRPHVRRAHQWGKNTRPLEEQRWVDACLVGAARLDEGQKPGRPIYHVG